ncbi:helix-turn-helix domain-containing protein [Mesorhizobium sp. P5_C1]
MNSIKSLDPKEVAKALFLAAGRKSDAAKALGLSRPSLYRFLELYPEIEPAVKTALEQPEPEPDFGPKMAQGTAGIIAELGLFPGRNPRKRVAKRRPLP